VPETSANAPARSMQVGNHVASPSGAWPAHRADDGDHRVAVEPAEGVGENCSTATSGPVWMWAWIPVRRKKRAWPASDRRRPNRGVFRSMTLLA
jgi:hypothetical protein